MGRVGLWPDLPRDNRDRLNPVEFNYDDIDAYIQHSRALRARYVREFFRGLFAKAKPAEVIGARVQTG